MRYYPGILGPKYGDIPTMEFPKYVSAAVLDVLAGGKRSGF